MAFLIGIAAGAVISACIFVLAAFFVDGR